MSEIPRLSLDGAIVAILDRGGGRVSGAAPLGLGKPNHLLNALYARFKAEPARQSEHNFGI